MWADHSLVHHKASKGYHCFPLAVRAALPDVITLKASTNAFEQRIDRGTHLLYDQYQCGEGHVTFPPLDFSDLCEGYPGCI